MGWRVRLLPMALENAGSPQLPPVVLGRAPALVYFVQQGSNGPIKIGASRNFDKRLRTLRTHSPVELNVIGTFPGGFDLERELHHELMNHQLEGEWFSPNDEVLAAFTRLVHRA